MIRLFLNAINKINTDLQEQIVKTAIAASILSTVYLLSGNIFLSFIIGLAIAILLLGWDSRVFIGIGLIFLIACPFLLALEQKALAEEMAVYAYYMLALGVILQIFLYAQTLFLAKPKASKRKKNAAPEFAVKQKILIFAVIIGIVFLLAFAGYFYYMYDQIRKESLTSQKLINSLIEANAKMEKQVASISVPAASVANKANISKNDMKIIIETNEGLAAIGQAFAKELNQLGFLNISFTYTTKAAEPSTLIEYCSDCYVFANELLTILQKPDTILFIEKSNLSQEIVVKIGQDQRIIANNEINISLLNGTAVAGAASKLKEIMAKDGFNISVVRSADKNNYQKTIIKYTSENIEKAYIVKKYLSPLYGDMDLAEDAQIQTDLEIIMGGM